MNHIINAGLQIIPLHIVDTEFTIVNNVINIVKASALPYTITPFNTVVNGSLIDIQQLVFKITAYMQKTPCQEYLLNIQIHAKTHEDCTFEQKLPGV
jgi:uncharacterized protein YqgV (UPF0045/DUF77 family)